MAQRSYQLSFSGGEISPLMRGRIDDVSYRSGYAYGRNGVVMPTGAWKKRGGFGFVKAAKHQDKVSRLMRFVYGNEDGYAMEWGEGSVRFHADGSTLIYATPRYVASYDTGADTITFTEAHGFSAGDLIRFTHKGVYPTWIASTGSYYVLVVSATVIQIEATLGGGAIDITGATAVDETAAWLLSELPRDYVASVTASSAVSPTFTFGAAHNYVVGDALTLTGSLPPEFSTGTVYYAIVPSSTTLRLATTKANADAGTAITFTGGNTPQFHYYYRYGDVVYWKGAIGAGTSSRVFWSDGDEQQNTPPPSAPWNQMPRDGTYEIAHGFQEDELREITYSQSFDVFATGSQAGEPFELRRELAEYPSGSHATQDVYRWAFKPATLAQAIEPPTNIANDPDYGEYHTFSIATTSGNFVVDGATPGGPITVVAGDTCYLESANGSGAAVTGIAGSPGFYMVSEFTAPNLIRLRRIDGSAEVTNTDGSTQTGVFRLAPFSSEPITVYKITAVSRSGEESDPSPEYETGNNLSVPGSSNTLSWTASEGAIRYRIYRKVQDALFGFIGETENTTFRDDGIEPGDLSLTPPIQDDELSATDKDYPAAVGHFQQKRYYGGTLNDPQGVVASRTGTEGSFTYHQPVQPDDRLRFKVEAYERAHIRHFVPMAHLIALTSSAEIRISGVNEDAIRPDSISARAISNVGCTFVRPIAASSKILFVGPDQHIYELDPQLAKVDDPPDLSARATHLFDGLTVVDSAQQKSPVPIEWFVLSDGTLLGITYMPSQNIRGWHVHSTDGEFESVCTVPEGGEDRLYAIVKRTIDGNTVRHVERLFSMGTPDALEDWPLLDSYVTYDGAATTTITGLDHLEGESVYALADGEAVGPFTVASGSITLTASASVVQVGLPFTARLRPLPPVMQFDGFGQGREKNAIETWVRVTDTAQFQMRKYDEMTETQYPSTAYEVPGLTDYSMVDYAVLKAPLEGSWNQDAQIEIVSSLPLPLTVVSLTMQVQGGG